MTTLTPAEWAALKSCWADLEGLPLSEQQRQVERAELSALARATLQSMLSLDDTADPRLDRSASEMLSVYPTADTGASMIGRRLGAFKVLRMVGRGGMGAVYEAERTDDAYQQRVAIKTIWRGADSAVLLQRFRSERQILAALQHPNIAQLLDGGSTAEGTPWLAMEFVEGTPIDEWCDSRQLDLPARLDLFQQVCAAVQHAHQRLVVHRDLKPSNILVNLEGTVKLLDFGVAKLIAHGSGDGTLTGAGFSPFTADYAAPEQLEEAPVSTAADVYALGGILTLLIAGAPPRSVGEAHPSELIRVIRDDVPRTPSQLALGGGPRVAAARAYATSAKLAHALRGELDAIASMALRREPSRRYASAEALRDDVRRYLRRERVLAKPDGFGYRTWTFIRRQRALSAAIGIVVVGLSAAAIATSQQARVARAEARRAERATTFLSGLVTGSNATSYDPLVRLAPGGTVAQLLDSALVRIPREFSDDARIRARLYTAIGANLVTQQRIERAVAVLDSAQQLAATGYGRNSPEYARARIEWAAQQLYLNGPLALADAVEEAEQIAGANRTNRELAARVALLRSARAMQLGRVGEADSLAAQVLANERGEARSMLSLRAEAMRMYASSWIRRDPRDYLKRARSVLRLADSLGLEGTNEQVLALSAEFEALLVLGRTDEASKALERMRSRMPTEIDTAATIRAQYAYKRAYLAGVAGDTVARRRAVDDLLRILQSHPAIGAGDRVNYTGTIVGDALARHDTLVALPLARELATSMKSSGSPMLISFADWYHGQAAVAAKQYDEALQAVAHGARALERVPDLESVLPLLRRVQWTAYQGLGRTAEADSLRKSVPQRGPIPNCTPGGNWKGCPDVP